MTNPTTTDKMKKKVFRVHDRVRVITPDIVVRVGYPLTKIAALEAVEKEYGDKVNAFVSEICGKDELNFDRDPHGYAIYNGVMAALASYWLKTKRYGGKERKIYTETNESLRNSNGWSVMSKRVVKTGIYDSGGMVNGYGDEPDYEPPHLANEQSHVLLSLTGSAPNYDYIEIEATNVEHCE